MTKYILIAALMLLIVSLGSAQVGQTMPVAPKVLQVQLNDSVAVGATYAASQSDTTVAYNLSGYSDAYLLFTSTDSVNVLVSYAASVEGATFEDGHVTIDSISTTGQGSAAANGIQRSLALPKAVTALGGVKLIFAFNAARNGVTTPKYTAKLVLK